MSIINSSATVAVNQTGTSSVIGASPSAGVHCNVSDTYRLYFQDGSTADLVLVSGNCYPYRVTKILTTGGGAVDSGDVYLLL